MSSDDGQAFEVVDVVSEERHPGHRRRPDPPGEGLGDLSTNLADFRRIAEREEHHFEALATRIAPAPVARVPFLADDVHDLDGLTTVGSFLFSG